MKTETTAEISARIQRQPGKPKQPPKYLICDDPISGPEVFVRQLGSFTLRMHDMYVIEGHASPEEIEAAKNFYVTYLQFIDADKNQ